jgi:uroporphyrinogen decarboxylase
LKDTIRSPEKAHELLEFSTIAAKKLIDACMVRGAFPILADPLASCSVISPNIFQNFALPYLKQLIDFMHRYDLDTMIHICGETELVLDSIPGTKTDLFSFDKNDEQVTKERLGNSIRLIGNVTPSELLHSTPEKIKEQVKNKILAMKDTPKGFIMATGCEVPIDTPIENVKTFIKTAHEFGHY